MKNKQKIYKKFFLQGSKWEKTFYKAYANKLTRVKNLSKKKNALRTINSRKKAKP